MNTSPTLKPLDMGELSALESLPLRARWLTDATGVGRHRSRRKGASMEFADYRDYQLGDDLRRVDWRLYGRTDRLHTRETYEETPLRVVLLLDVSASMAYGSRPGHLTKIDFARSVLAAMALLVRRQRDACGVGLLADDLLQYLAPSTSLARLRAVWGVLDMPVQGQNTALAEAISRAANASPRSCLFIVASDFYEDPIAIEAVMRRLRFQRHDVIAFHIIDPVEEDFSFEDPAEFVDMETGEKLRLDPAAMAKEYRKEIAAHKSKLDDLFRTNGFDYLRLRTDEAPISALTAYLSRRAGKG